MTLALSLSVSSSSTDSDDHRPSSPFLPHSPRVAKSPFRMPLPSRAICSLVAVIFVFVQILFVISSQAPLRTIVESGNSWLAGTKNPSPPKSNTGAGKSDNTFNDVRTLWSESEPFPQTKLIRHATGFSVFDNLYSINGAMVIVTDTPEAFPPLMMMISSGVPIEDTPERMRKLEPTEKNIQIISVKEGKKLLGKQVGFVRGVSFINNDDPQYITHYFHFSAELFFGLWRTYSSLDPDIHANGSTILPPPSRLIFTHTPQQNWRDYAAMNQFVFHSSFPSAALEFKEDWEDRGNMEMGWVYERVVLADRGTAMRSQPFQETWRFASSAFELPGRSRIGEEGGEEGVKDPSYGWWWSPIRRNVVRFAAARRKTSLFVKRAGELVYGRQTHGREKRPVVTYVSRQEWGRRMLRQADHEVLVAELRRLEREENYELNIVQMEKMTREEQLVLAGKTDILMGVHGNGLTALLWMEPKPYTTVMEFFCPDGFARDYEWTASRLGITHYGFWNDRSFTAPNLPPMQYPSCFQGNDIPLDGKAVARLVKERLDMRFLAI